MERWGIPREPNGHIAGANPRQGREVRRPRHDGEVVLYQRTRCANRLGAARTARKVSRTVTRLTADTVSSAGSPATINGSAPASRGINPEPVSEAAPEPSCLRASRREISDTVRPSLPGDHGGLKAKISFSSGQMLLPSQVSHRASLKLPAVQAAIANGRPMIAGFSNRVETIPIGGHGLARG